MEKYSASRRYYIALGLGLASAYTAAGIRAMSDYVLGLPEWAAITFAAGTALGMIAVSFFFFTTMIEEI